MGAQDVRHGRCAEDGAQGWRLAAPTTPRTLPVCERTVHSTTAEEGGRERERRVAPERHKNRPETPADSMPRLVLAVCAAGAAAAVYALHRRRRRPVHVGPHSAVGVVGMGVMGSQVSHCNGMTALTFFLALRTSWLDCFLDTSSADLSAFLVPAFPPKPACAQLCGEAEAACLWTRS